MSEAFNTIIIEERDKLTMTMLKEIKTYMMERWASNRMRFRNYSDDVILPNIGKR